MEEGIWMMNDFFNSYTQPKHEYFGIPVKWDEDSTLDVSYGTEYRAKQKKTEYEEHDVTKTDPRLRKLARIVIEEGIQAKASDIIILPQEGYGIVKFRLDNAMVPNRMIDKDAMDGLMIVLKDMAKAPLNDWLKPTIDCHIAYDYNGTHIDLRLAFSPTEKGLFSAIRILNSSSLVANLDSLNLPPRVLDAYRKALHSKEGLIVMTGGTGSGKSTTLATGLLELQATTNHSKNIVTVENPVEYVLPDMAQSSINPNYGFDWDDGIQAMLRQNPDVIEVGETNDPKTAKAVTRAATTGHLVFTTIHANNTLEVSNALRQYGVSTQDLTNALRLIVYQTLENKLCEHCKLDRPVSVAEKRWLDKNLYSNVEIALVSENNPQGCEHCKHTGYKGRVLLAEMLESNAMYRELENQMKLKGGTLDQLKTALLTVEGANFYPLEFDIHKHLRDGDIDMTTATRLVGK